MVEPGATVEPTARLSKTVVWHEATVGAGVVLDGCVVAGDVAIPAGFRVSSNVIVPASAARTHDDADVRDGMAVFGL
jgi:predicted acyltransferase (DUF342 family)